MLRQLIIYVDLKYMYIEISLLMKDVMLQYYFSLIAFYNIASQGYYVKKHEVINNT